jgi:hypothetical protein
MSAGQRDPSSGGRWISINRLVAVDWAAVDAGAGHYPALRGVSNCGRSSDQRRPGRFDQGMRMRRVICPLLSQ